MEFVRRTISLSPLTNRKIPAEIWRDGNRVFMTKTDEAGNRYRALVENDWEFYRLRMLPTVYEQIDFKGAIVYFTTRCNMKCPLCYEALKPGESGDLDLAELERFTSQYRGKYFALGGREPTMRRDLPEAIRIIEKQNGAYLMSNGIRLADAEYCAELKKAGLRQVSFQFYGFKDEYYQTISGRPLLETKLQALENLETAGIDTRLSITLARGSNDGELGNIFDYVARKRGFIDTLSIRSAAAMGRHVDVEQLTINDLVDRICEQVGFERQHILNELEFHRLLGQALGKPIFHPKVCTMLFHARQDKDGRWYGIGRDIDLNRLRRKGPLAWPILAAEVGRVFGWRFYPDHLKDRFAGQLTDVPNAVRVFLKSWPTIYNIDMIEMNKCGTGYYRGGVFRPFCVMNVIESNNTDEEFHPVRSSFVEVQPAAGPA